jgi:hypothetical protein
VPGSTSSSSSKPNGGDLPQQRGFLRVTIDGKAVLLRDVKVSEWFARYVYELVSAGVASGYRDARGTPTGEFGPANPVTYAEIAKMALLVAGKDVSPTGTPQNHSARGQWSAPYIRAAEDLQVSVFTRALDVNRPATRGAVAQIVLESLGIPLSPGTASYGDLPPSHPHADALQTATALGIMGGDTNRDGSPKGTIRPDDPITHSASVMGHAFPSTKSITQHPRTCGPSPRQWERMSSLSHPAS